MNSPALALTPVPIATGTGAGAATGTLRVTATGITRRVRTRMKTGERGTGAHRRPSNGRERPAFPSPSTVTAATSVRAGSARD
jgi:hypothetical protein